jgi:hypothetical protein
LGLGGTFLDWIKNDLTDKELKVIINGITSNVRHINAGVPQGSILGPLLFILYIDDLPEKLKDTAILNADDSSIICTIKDKKNRKAAANSLNKDLRLIPYIYEHNTRRVG